MAGQANAAVLGTFGETSVLVTAVMGKEDRNIDYLMYRFTALVSFVASRVSFYFPFVSDLRSLCEALEACRANWHLLNFYESVLITLTLNREAEDHQRDSTSECHDTKRERGAMIFVCPSARRLP